MDNPQEQFQPVAPEMPQQTPPQYYQAPPQMPPAMGGNNKLLILVVIIAAAAALGFGAWAILGRNSYQQTQQNPEPTYSNNTPGVPSESSQPAQQEARLEFPWNRYQAEKTAAPYSNSGLLIGEAVNLAGYSKATTVVTKTFNAAASTRTTKAYVFESVNLALNGRIETLYVEGSTAVYLATGATVGQKIVMAHNELVKAASDAAGIQTSGTSVNPTPTTVNKTPTPTPSSPSPSSAPSGPNPYQGSWNGSFSPSSIAAQNGCLGGTASLTVTSGGALQGWVTIEGQQFYGGGTVDSKGKMSGAWTISSNKVTLTGQMSGNSASGSYIDKFGCYGSFVLSK
jgi:hypothetical protein